MMQVFKKIIESKNINDLFNKSRIKVPEGYRFITFHFNEELINKIENYCNNICENDKIGIKNILRRIIKIFYIFFIFMINIIIFFNK